MGFLSRVFGKRDEGSEEASPSADLPAEVSPGPAIESTSQAGSAYRIPTVRVR